MPIILVIIVLVLLLGGGGAYYGSRSGWGGPHYGGGLLGLVLLILLILWLTGNLGGGPMMSENVRPTLTGVALAAPAERQLAAGEVRQLECHRFGKRAVRWPHAMAPLRAYSTAAARPG